MIAAFIAGFAIGAMQPVRDGQIERLLSQSANNAAFEQLIQISETGTVAEKILVLQGLSKAADEYGSYWSSRQLLENSGYANDDSHGLYTEEQNNQKRLVQTLLNGALSDNVAVSHAAVLALLDHVGAFPDNPSFEQRPSMFFCGTGYSDTLDAKISKALTTLGEKYSGRLTFAINGDDKQSAYKACFLLPSASINKRALIDRWSASSDPILKIGAEYLLCQVKRDSWYINKYASFLLDENPRVAKTAALLCERADDLLQASGTRFSELPLDIRKIMMQRGWGDGLNNRMYDEAGADPAPWIRLRSRLRGGEIRTRIPNDELIDGALHDLPEYATGFLELLSRQGYTDLGDVQRQLLDSGKCYSSTLIWLGKNHPNEFTGVLRQLAAHSTRLVDAVDLTSSVLPFISMGDLKKLTYDSDAKARANLLEAYSTADYLQAKGEMRSKEQLWVWRRKSQDSDPEIRQSAYESADPSMPEQRSFMLQYVASADPETKVDCIRRLTARGKIELPTLKNFAASSDPQVREYAELALALLQGKLKKTSWKRDGYAG